MKYLTLLAAVLLASGWFIKHEREESRETAIIDSFEYMSDSGYRIRFHNSSTNYEAVCRSVLPDSSFVCMPYSAGERHRFANAGGTIIFFDAPVTADLPYRETKESVR
jgi:hypothetical protein